MLTLAEMADLVCEKLNKQDDEESVVVCKKFLRRAYKTIWNSVSWREAYQPVTAKTMLYDAGARHDPICILPDWVDTVMAVRLYTDNTPVEYLDPVQVFRIDGDRILFTDTDTTPLYFHRLPPCSVVEAYPGVLRFLSDSSADGGKKIYVREDPYSWHPSEQSHLGASSNEVGRLLGYQDNMGSETVTLTGTNLIATNYQYMYPIITKEQTAGTIRCVSNDLQVALCEFGPNETSKYYPRIQIRPNRPLADGEIVVLAICKRKAETLQNDLDVPSLQNTTDCMMSFAQADMLERSRNYVKAAQKRTDAMLLLDQLRDLEANQNVNITRIIPWVDAEPYQRR